VEPHKLKKTRHYNTLAWSQNTENPISYRSSILKMFRKRMPADPRKGDAFGVPYLDSPTLKSRIRPGELKFINNFLS